MPQEGMVPLPEGATFGQAGQTQSLVPLPDGATLGKPIGGYQAAATGSYQAHPGGAILNAETGKVPDDPGFLAGLWDNLAGAVKGMGRVASAEYQHLAAKPTQDFHDGSYAKGVKDAAVALIKPDPDSPLHKALRETIINTPIRETGKALGSMYDTIRAQMAGESGLPELGHAVKHTVGAVPGIGPAIVHSGEEMNERPKYGLGDAIGNLIQVVAPEAIAESGVLGKVGARIEENASRGPNSILRAKSEKNFLYGKDPGRALIDENIRPTNNVKNLAEQLQTAGDDLHSSVQSVLNSGPVSQVKIDVVPGLNRIVNDFLNDMVGRPGMRNRQAVVEAVQKLKTDLTTMSDPQTGRPVPGSQLARDLSPAEVNELKKSVGDNVQWDKVPGSTDPVIVEKVNNLRKNIYAYLNEAIEHYVKSVSPETSVKELNARYANVIEAKRLLAKRIASEEVNELGLSRLLSHTGKGAFIGGVLTGHPWFAAGAAAEQAWRSTMGRILRGKGFDALGGGMQHIHPGGLAAAAAAVGPSAKKMGDIAEGALSDEQR
jgi:hypothetical protein